MIVISIFSIVLLVFTIIYIVKQFLQRKNRISKCYFEVYTDAEFKLVFYLIFAAMFTLFCCLSPFVPESSFAALIPCFVIQIIFSFLAINYCRPKVKIENDSVSILNFFVYRTLFLKEITEIKFKNYNINLIIENGKNYVVSNYCKNFEKFLQFLKSNAISCDKKLFSQIIRIRTTLLTKISGQFISLAFIIAGISILVIKYADAGQDIWFTYLLISLGIFMSALFSLSSFRWKIDITKDKIVYVPLIGKKRTYNTKTIDSIHISTSYGYRGSKFKEICIKLSKTTICIPYRSAGVQQFIDTYKHKITYDSAT